jgi:hypothetical protein
MDLYTNDDALRLITRLTFFVIATVHKAFQMGI